MYQNVCLYWCCDTVTRTLFLDAKLLGAKTSQKKKLLGYPSPLMLCRSYSSNARKTFIEAVHAYSDAMNMCSKVIDCELPG